MRDIAARSVRERRIRDEATRCHDDDQRACIRQYLPTKRYTIQREKQSTHFDFVLQNLRPGGWGKAALAKQKKSQGLTTLRQKDAPGSTTTTTDVTAIADAATTPYTTLFALMRRFMGEFTDLLLTLLWDVCDGGRRAMGVGRDPLRNGGRPLESETRL